MKNDLREYSDAELSMHVMNDEDLYRLVRRERNLRLVRETLAEHFIFTDDQWAELVQDIDDDRHEDGDHPN